MSDITPVKCEEAEPPAEKAQGEDLEQETNGRKPDSKTLKLGRLKSDPTRLSSTLAQTSRVDRFVRFIHDEVIPQLKGSATYFRYVHQVTVNQLLHCSLWSATLTIGNVIFRQQVDLIGGWIPFCFTAGFLNCVSAFLAYSMKNGQMPKQEDASIRLLTTYETLERKFQKEGLTTGDCDKLEVKLDKADVASRKYRLEPHRTWPIWRWLLVYVTLLVYFGWAAWTLHGKWDSLPSNKQHQRATEPQSQPTSTHRSQPTSPTSGKDGTGKTSN